MSLSSSHETQRGPRCANNEALKNTRSGTLIASPQRITNRKIEN